MKIHWIDCVGIFLLGVGGLFLMTHAFGWQGALGIHLCVASFAAYLDAFRRKD